MANVAEDVEWVVAAPGDRVDRNVLELFTGSWWLRWSSCSAAPAEATASDAAITAWLTAALTKASEFVDPGDRGHQGMTIGGVLVGRQLEPRLPPRPSPENGLVVRNTS